MCTFLNLQFHWNPSKYEWSLTQKNENGSYVEIICLLTAIFHPGETNSTQIFYFDKHQLDENNKYKITSKMLESKNLSNVWHKLDNHI